MTAKEIMINVLLKVVTVTGDVEPVDVQSIVNNDEFQRDMWYMSLNSFHEARGESFKDKVAVSQSVMHRMNDTVGEFRRYDDVVSIITKSHRDDSGNVVKNRCWYSWYCDGKSDTPPLYYNDGTLNKLEYQAWTKSVIAAFYAYEDLYPDLIGGSTHYYNPNLADAYWKDSYEEYGMVGSHRFYTQK